MTHNPHPPSEYAQFRQTFFEECGEILADMENKLGRLNESGLDRDELNAVFRCVHSIKAGAGAFNYTELVTFAHSFEALLDRLRDGALVINADIASLIIRATDILAELVNAAQQGRDIEEGFGHDIAIELHQVLQSNTEPNLGSDFKRDDVSLKVKVVANAIKNHYRIEFTPNLDLMRHANEPLLLIKELKHLGDLTVICDATKVPKLEDIDVESLYLKWIFELISECSHADITGVFEFVDEDCTLLIRQIEPPIDSGDGNDGYGIFEPIVPQTLSTSKPIIRQQDTLSTINQSAKAANTTSIRVELNRVDRLVNMVGELVIAQAMLKQEIAISHHKLGDATIQSHEALEILTRELQECVMAIRMQPIKSVFSRMPRLLRDVAAKLGKQVRLNMSGEHTELDKTVIEELSDPLTHMIIN